MSDPSRKAVFELLTPSHKWRVDGASVVRLLGLCWIGAAAWFVDTQFSLAVGAGLVALGVIARPVTTVAVGHAALIPLAFEPVSTASLGLFGGGLLLLLLGERPSTPIVAVLTVSGAVGLAATAGVVFTVGGVTAAGAFVVTALAVISALLYRYEQLSVDRILDVRREAESDSQDVIL